MFIFKNDGWFFFPSYLWKSTCEKKIRRILAEQNIQELSKNTLKPTARHDLHLNIFMSPIKYSELARKKHRRVRQCQPTNPPKGLQDFFRLCAKASQTCPPKTRIERRATEAWASRAKPTLLTTLLNNRSPATMGEKNMSYPKTGVKTRVKTQVKKR